ncbi:MAG: type II toxin-antitoxin system VapC family toxin [Betaproteobacteria bacterium]|nr:type II toxin-antitoxin system VapC family toxin [Betaproteobacteria bacterium]MDE2124764.1 type II toxin-antitoxin system VapC family toxin [Betaproteobacteria bacterium]MDE2187468.1 type II toxin-antitoxin system VapC family toxin [Betaproteobacteria bacterium]MDE2325330.1 type II toxin-antitoxin system VapC family toxin [Betaproteobacteria bacterium]
MLRYLLDTNICIYLMKEQPESVIRRFAACKPGEIGVSSITWAELCCGLNVHNSQSEMATLLSRLTVKDFDADAAALFGKLSQQFPARKSSFDRMIAAHALSLGATLVTNNTADFDLYAGAGLIVENWVAG